METASLSSETRSATEKPVGNLLFFSHSLSDFLSILHQYANRTLAITFLIIALPSCLFFAAVVPPGQVADEVAHAMRVYGVAHGTFFSHNKPVPAPTGNGKLIKGGGLKVDPALMTIAGLTLQNELMTKEKYDRLVATPWANQQTFLNIGPIATYLPIFYLPSGAAAAISRIIQDDPYSFFIAGRIGQAIAFTLIGVAAMLAAKRGLTVLFCTLCFPMTLSLGGSLNQDGLIIATSVLGGAMLTRVEPGCNPLRSRAWWIGGLAMLAVSLSKPPYFPLLALLLLPFPAPLNLRALKPQVLVILAGFALVIGWTVVGQIFMGSELGFADKIVPDPAGGPPLVYGSPDPILQLKYVLAHPALIFTLPWHTLFSDPWMVRQMIGLLGWLRISMPPWLYGLWMVAVVTAVAADVCRRKVGRVGAWDAALIILIGFSCIEGIYLSQYLVWTHLHYPLVEGPQGRYLLPLMPLLALLIPGLKNAGPGWAPFAVPPVLAAVIGLAVVPQLIVATHYLH